MKHYLIPYIVAKKDTWWAGIDFLNFDVDNDTSITIRVYRHSNGVLANTIEATIKPMCHYILYPEPVVKNLVEADEGRATILVDCSENVYVTTFMGRNEGFGLVPHYEVKDLKK